MYHVYILKSSLHDRYYIGHTSNLDERITRHNLGKVRSTKAYKSWILVYSEECNDKTTAIRRELEIKSYKSGEGFKRLIKKDCANAEGWLSGRKRLS